MAVVGGWLLGDSSDSDRTQHLRMDKQYYLFDIEWNISTMTDLDLTSIRCFLAAARLESFRAGAESMCISPAAFGQRIGRLEDQLGVELFTRTTRRITLTRHGRHAVRLAQSLLEGCERFRTEVRSPTGVAEYELTIGTRFELGLSWLTPAINALEEKRPERVIHLSFGDGDAIARRVSRRLIDGAITSSPSIPDGLHAALLHRERYVLVGNPTFLRENPLESPSDAPAHTLLDLSPALELFRYFLDECTGERPWMFGQTRYLGTIAAVRIRLLERGGIAVLPEYFVRNDLAAGALETCLPGEPLRTDSFRLIWPPEHPNSAEMMMLAHDLRESPLC